MSAPRGFTASRNKAASALLTKREMVARSATFFS
jgi:hypothetical protein